MTSAGQCALSIPTLNDKYARCDTMVPPPQLEYQDMHAFFQRSRGDS
jgi:hypothetical protein